MMKGLATALFAVLAWSVFAGAGPLEFAFAAGPSAMSLASLNDSIGVFNALIEHLNETADVHPDLAGEVLPLGAFGSGLSLHAGERYWLAGGLALGASIDYFRTSTDTLGHYEGADVSTVDLSFDLTTISGLLNVRATFVDLGIRLSADVGVGYYHAITNRSVVFEVPPEYPDVLSGVPPDGTGRYSGGTFGFEAGLALTVPVADWFVLGTTVAYRSATVQALHDGTGAELDVDGDGRSEPAQLGGMTVRLMLALRIDLGLGGEKE